MSIDIWMKMAWAAMVCFLLCWYFYRIIHWFYQREINKFMARIKKAMEEEADPADWWKK